MNGKMNYVSNAKNIAEVILYLSGSCITPKKLQKLLYISYSMYLVLNNNSAYEKQNNRLFENNFEAWAHGPVLPQIYAKYREYGMNRINTSTTNIEQFGLKPETISFLGNIMSIFDKYQAHELEEFTHKQSAWINARKGTDKFGICKTKILDKDIYEDYCKYVS